MKLVRNNVVLSIRPEHDITGKLWQNLRCQLMQEHYLCRQKYQPDIISQCTRSAQQVINGCQSCCMVRY